MNDGPNQPKAIFLEAVEQHAPAQWSAFLDRACAGQPELRRRVEVLLAAHEEAGTDPQCTTGEALRRGPLTATTPRKAPAPRSARTSCWSRSAKGAWARSSGPSRTSRFGGKSPSK